MSTRTHISKWGSSLAIRIPKEIADQWGVREGSPIEIAPSGDRIVLRRATYDLDRMLELVTDDNLHADQDYWPPQGIEAW